MAKLIEHEIEGTRNRKKQVESRGTQNVTKDYGRIYKHGSKVNCGGPNLDLMNSDTYSGITIGLGFKDGLNVFNVVQGIKPGFHLVNY